MAAVGLTKGALQKILPEGIFIACENSSDNNTIAGPDIITRDFVKNLQEAGVFAKVVESANIAFHTKYLNEAGVHFKLFIAPLFTNPKPRTSRWISTSVSYEQVNEPWANLDCMEYHLNSYSNPVLFYQIYKHIPRNAIAVEVAPHGLLQAILKRQLSSTVSNIALGNTKSSDSHQYLLNAIGK